MNLEGYNQDTINEHLRLLDNDGLIDGAYHHNKDWVLWTDLKLKSKGFDELEKQKMNITALANTNLSNKRNEIFIVHGHDEKILSETRSFLQTLNIKFIVLRDEPNSGRTVIEKFEKYSDRVKFAVVLLTPDDRGGEKSNSYEEQKFRARQNIYFACQQNFQNFIFPVSQGKTPYPCRLKAGLKTVFSFPCIIPIAWNKRIFYNFKALNGIT